MRRHRRHFSFPVWRRQLASDMLDLLPLLGEVLCEGWPRVFMKSRVWDPYPTAWRNAARRLSKAGLITIRRSAGKPALLHLTAVGNSRVSDWLWPERFWNRGWDERWHVLVYDVPETYGGYRRALQGFLRRARMGCLQKSVWIAARDIRPLVHDLEAAASLEDIAILFEAYTMMGKTGPDLAARAWDFDRVDDAHRRYLHPEAPLKPPSSWRLTFEAMRTELRRFARAMADDPLLPAELYPSFYQGPAVVAAFRQRLVCLCKAGFKLARD